MQAYTKAIIAIVMSIVGALNQFVDLPMFLNEDWVSAIVLAATPFLVFWFPNIPDSGGR